MTHREQREYLHRKRRDLEVETRFLEGVRHRCPDHALLLKALGDLYTRTGKHADGLSVDLRLAQLCPEESEVWYNLGCSYALVGEREQALDALRRALDLGYSDYDWMLKDADLECLRNDPRFIDLLEHGLS
ncbi:MAG: tetratricopeptide repeat protein [Verrucomicrobia bacterium]|nr:tetratricopeptide repeat protein [Verrucomicrobiota bacterium]